MAYIVLPDYGPRHTGTRLEFPDGDAALKAYCAHARIDAASPIKVSWECGVAIPSAVVPTRVRILKGKGPYDWAQIGNPVLVSSRFRDCVEMLDPGRHGFFPVTVEDRNGVARPEPFYLFNVIGRVDSIIEAKSNLSAVGRGQVDGWGYSRRVGAWHCALDRSVIADRACWTEIRYTRRWFFSERLANLLRKHRLSGFKLHDHCAELDPG
ncbi:MAG TPA: DUF1629 domain-containing protein [Rhizomicrobium sp.]|jgi:hypothetical protein